MLRSLRRRLQGTPAKTIVRVISPLDIPEILEFIFSYLSDNTIRHSIVPVCRLWRDLTQHRLVREVTWHQSWGTFRKWKALRKIPGAGRLHYCQLLQEKWSSANLKCQFDPHVLGTLRYLDVNYRKQLRNQMNRTDKTKMTTTTASNDNGNVYNKQRPGLMSTRLPPFDFSLLRELNVYLAMCRTNTLERFLFPSSLTKLTLTIKSTTNATIDFNWVLANCPLLEYFQAEGHGVPAYDWKILTLKSSFSLRYPPSPFPLRSLVLCNIYYAQIALENLLLFTPNLKELKLVATMWHNKKRTQYNWTQLFATLKARNIRLNRAHFSTLGHRMSAEQTEELVTDIYPYWSSERSLWALDVTPQLLQSVFFQSATLTTLEVLWKRVLISSSNIACSQALGNSHQFVHQYLCESPYLIHLTTLKTVIRLDELDIFFRRGYTDLDQRQDPTPLETSHDSRPFPPHPSSSVWRCHGLQTLHLVVHHSGLYPLKDQIYARILFGYVSRVCPSLEDLEIRIAYSCHNRLPRDSYTPELHMQLKGGLCLLSRMQHLQRLRVYLDDGYAALHSEEWNLDWLVASGRKRTHSRKMRLQEMESWREWRLNEDRVEAMRARTRQQISDSGTSSSDSSPFVIGQLKNLGLLLDVEEALKEMEGVKTFRPLPCLGRLSFNYPILLRPKEELERLFSQKSKKWRSLSFN